MGTWIVNWDLVIDDRKYLVRAVYEDSEGRLYLAPVYQSVQPGWQVKLLTPKCYAVLLLPDSEAEQAILSTLFPKDQECEKT